MKNLSLRAKLFGVLGILSAVAVCIAYVGVTRLSGINSRLDTIVEVTSMKQLLANQMRASLLEVHRAEKNFVLSQTKEDMDKYATAMAKFEKALLEQKSKLAGLVGDVGRQQLEEFDKTFAQYKQIQTQVCAASRKNTNAQAFELSRGTGRELFDKGDQLLQAMAQRNDKHVEELVGQMKVAADSDAARAKLTGLADSTQRAVLASHVGEDFLALQRAEKNLILERTTEGMKKYGQEIGERADQIEQRLAEIEKTATEEGRQDVAAFRTALTGWLDNNRKVIALSLENSNEEARLASATTGRAAMDAAEQLLDSVSQRAEEDMLADVRQSGEQYATARLLMFSVAGIGIAVGVLLGWLIIRGVTRAFKNLLRGLRTMSAAELDHTGAAFTRIIDSMVDGVGQVNDAAAQVSAASQQLAAGASEQASSLEETSSALEEMAAMARTNAEHSRQANELATAAHKAAEDGEHTMTGINDASDKISKIIKVIEEIAFQTNLLALNAAVEAARAGEHGKGFAVVAEEVRNLAQRAAGAAKETTSLIEDSVNKSREGKTAIQSIVSGVAKVTELINGISQASAEQAQGVEQVNTAVSQMDKVTQQNAAGAEESASAAEQLSAQAATTQGLVDELIALVRGAEGSRRRASTARTSSETQSKTSQKRPNAGAHFAKPAKTPKAPPQDTRSHSTERELQAVAPGQDLSGF
jgi:methyl-accepting chemotaxis protein